MKLVHARGELSLDHCAVMGILNRTPDSFFDGGRMDLTAAAEHGLRLVEEGASIIDIGAVKAGPGEEVTEQQEIGRLIPLIEELAGRSSAPLSVETGRPEVVRRAVEAGAAIVNDVTGLMDEDLAAVCADVGAGLVLMHHGGQIRGRPRHPRYDDVVEEVGDELRRLASLAMGAGVAQERIAIDPGLDFGKNTLHSLELVRRLPELTAGELPVLVAASRKDIIGESLGLPPDERLEGSLAIVALSVAARAAMVRVHDVEASVRVVRMVEAIEGRSSPVAPLRGLWD
ncbi:MAG: dihydropteroate synthase [Actinomycetota bacterium]